MKSLKIKNQLNFLNSNHCGYNFCVGAKMRFIWSPRTDQVYTIYDINRCTLHFLCFIHKIFVINTYVSTYLRSHRGKHHDTSERILNMQSKQSKRAAEIIKIFL